MTFYAHPAKYWVRDEAMDVLTMGKGARRRCLCLATRRDEC